MTRTATTREQDPVEPGHVNAVRLVGRISGDPEETTLPSGDTVWNFRLVVERPPDRSRPGQSVDTLDCAVWSGRTKRSVPSWTGGDLVEVEGSVRRRFYSTGAGKASRYEVEVRKGRLICRAASG